MLARHSKLFLVAVALPAIISLLDQVAFRYADREHEVRRNAYRVQPVLGKAGLQRIPVSRDRFEGVTHAIAPGLKRY
jgi:hypothetical protein